MLSYFDFAAGSMLVAAFAGGMAGVAVLLRMYWHRFLGIFSKKHRMQADTARAQLQGEADATDDATDDDASASVGADDRAGSST